MQPVLDEPDLAGQLGWMNSRGPFQPLTFCDSVLAEDQVSTAKGTNELPGGK